MIEKSKWFNNQDSAITESELLQEQGFTTRVNRLYSMFWGWGVFWTAPEEKEMGWEQDW